MYYSYLIYVNSYCLKMTWQIVFQLMYVILLLLLLCTHILLCRFYYTSSKNINDEVVVPTNQCIIYPNIMMTMALTRWCFIKFRQPIKQISSSLADKRKSFVIQRRRTMTKRKSCRCTITKRPPKTTTVVQTKSCQKSPRVLIIILQLRCDDINNTGRFRNFAQAAVLLWSFCRIGVQVTMINCLE
jgi:hypothetical protein